MPVSPPYHHYAQYPPPLPTPRSFHRPPPESALLVDPTRFLVALPVCVLALGLAYRLDCLPLELHLLARLVHVKMGLLGSLFGFGRKAGAGKEGEGEPEWALENRRQRASDVERCESTLGRSIDSSPADEIVSWVQMLLSYRARCLKPRAIIQGSLTCPGPSASSTPSSKSVSSCSYLPPPFMDS